MNDKPKNYEDYLRVNIDNIKNRIKNNQYDSEHLKYARSEINRLRYRIKHRLTRMPVSAFILQ